MAKTRIVQDVAANAEPLTLAVAKEHLRLIDIGGSHPHDALITGLCVTARRTAEHHCNRAFAVKTLELALDAFPKCGDPIEVEVGPIAAISSIKYRDTTDVLVTLDSNSYFAEDCDGKRRVFLVPTVTEWPTVGERRDNVRVQYTTPADCPSNILSAMKLLVGHLYNNPSASIAGTIITEIPLGVRHLLDVDKEWAGGL